MFETTSSFCPVTAEPANGMVELTETAIDAVAGGINPQPLPPSHEGHLD